MASCDLCGKGRIFGISKTHRRGVAGGQWKKKAPKTQKIFLPNLHYSWVTIKDKKMRMRLCTKCLRMMKQGYKTESPKEALLVNTPEVQLPIIVK